MESSQKSSLIKPPIKPGLQTGSFNHKESDHMEPDHMEPLENNTGAATVAGINFEAIAAALPGNWTVSPQQSYVGERAYLTRADGLKLWASEGFNMKGKLSVSMLAQGPNNQHVALYRGSQKLERPSGNFSLAKSPEKIAAEIARRILPDAEEALILLNKEIALIQKAADTRESSLKRVSAALGVPARTSESWNSEQRFTGGVRPAGASCNRGYGNFTVNNGGSVDFKLQSLPIDKAEKLAALLKEFFAA